MSITEKAYKKVTDENPRPVAPQKDDTLPEEQLKDVSGGVDTTAMIPSDGYATCC